MTPAEELWSRAVKVLKSEMPPVSFDNWVRDLKPVFLDESTLVLVADSVVKRNTLRSRYQPDIDTALRFCSGKEFGALFIIESERNNYERHEPEAPKGPKTLNARYTFDTFVIGSSNRFAHAGALAVAENPSNAYNPLFLYSGVGLGKTHLMHAIGHYVYVQNPALRVMYVTGEVFTNELIAAIQSGRNVEFRDRYRNVDLLLVDDVQFIEGKESTQEEFFHTFNTLHGGNKQIVITSDKPPKQMSTLEERLRSRFEWGLIADIQPPDLETRIAILRKKAESAGVTCTNDALGLIASKIESNIRELEGTLTRIIAYSRLTNKPLSYELAEEALKDFFPSTSRKHISPEFIMDVVSAYYKVSVADLTGKKRSRDITLPRQIAMYLCRDIIDMSLPKIGEAFGGRDHTTVMYGTNKIADDLAASPRFRTEMEDLIKRIFD